ncbi:MAG: mechanosensitive ion channel family protein [Spirochaetales bacterium]|nr:mechanosensitive ion channel family protein [Spirochaetales bacterium]
MKGFIKFMELYGVNYVTTAIIAFLGILIVRNILKLIEKGLLDSTLDNSLISFFVTLCRILLYVGLLFIILGRLGIPLTGIVSALSAITLAIGLAIQDIIGGVANGLMLVTSKLFKVDDYVEIGGMAGSVKEIKLLHTILITPDNKTVTIPNKTVFSSGITNYSAMKQRRIDMVVGVDYDTNIEKAKKVILNAALKNHSILTSPAPMVKVKNLGDSEVQMLLRVWVNSEDYWEVTWYLNEYVLKALNNNGINVPFPQVTLSYRDNGGEDK